MLRAYAAKVTGYADYLENVRIPAEKPDASAEARAAEEKACAEFSADPGAHATRQRIEFEAELFDAIEKFKRRVRHAANFRACKPITRDGDPAFLALQALVGEITRTKF